MSGVMVKKTKMKTRAKILSSENLLSI
jgi:hypothetical protein